MNYLLPAQTLLDLCAEESNPVQVWAQSVDSTALRMSVVSIAQALATVAALPDAQIRARLEADLTSLLADIAADAGPPLAFQTSHADIWKALIGDKTLTGLQQTDRQVYATAMHEGLTVVERARLHTTVLQALGVDILVLKE